MKRMTQLIYSGMMFLSVAACGTDSGETGTSTPKDLSQQPFTGKKVSP